MILFAKQKIKKLLPVLFCLLTMSVPYLVSAKINNSSNKCNDVGKSGATFSDFAECVVDIVSEAFVPYIFALGLLAFAVGVFGYIKNAEDESRRSDSVKLISWSLVGLFFMVTVWVFALMFSIIFGNDSTSNIIIPQF